jgi:Lar family restriction alleviation protein
MDELKPCPFCGGEVELLDYTDRIYGFWDYKIKCKKCRAYMDSPSTAVVRFTAHGLHQTRNAETMQKAKHELITIWNRRADYAKVH